MTSGIRKRIGLFGGSFDPLHCGHLIMAQDAVEAMGLDQLYFIPAKKNPLKEIGPVVDGVDRLGMIESAIGGDERFGCLDWEILEPEEPSYSLRTVERAEAFFQGAELFWILGQDQGPDMGKWHQIERLVEKVRFVVLERPGEHLEFPDLAGLSVDRIGAHRIEISATEIRRRIKEGKPVDFLVPSSVLTYIETNGLYRDVSH